MFKFIVDAYGNVSYFLNNLYQEFKRFRRFVVQLPSLLKMSYLNSNDVDWGTILSFMMFKIQRIRNHVAEHKHHMDWERDVAAMDKFLFLADQATTCEHTKELEKEWEAYEKKYGSLNFSFVNGTMIRAYDPHLTEEQKKEADAVRLDLYGKEADLQEKYWNEAMDLLKQSMRNWWC